MRFTDTHFIIIYQLLSNPEKHWTTLDFSNCHRPSVVRLFNYLIDRDLLYREHSRGRNSCTILMKPAELLKLCTQKFKNNEEKVISFISKRADTDLIQDLLGAKVEFYTGRFSGIRRRLIHSTVSGLSLLFPDRSLFYGENLLEFQMDYKLLKVSFGGNITIILPRYKEFLRKYSFSQDGIMFPPDFYSYLYLSTTDNIMALPQKKYMENQLGGVNGNFLTWR